MFKNLFSFNGRIRRTEYGLTIIINIILTGIVNLIGESDPYDNFTKFIYILYIPLLWFRFSQGAKRCHDRGNSGWYQLIPFYQLWLIFGDSINGENEYGPNPKGLGNTDEINEIGNYLIK
jgi:uncharacterized membrane protein YhaH (DUF805 family)